MIGVVSLLPCETKVKEIVQVTGMFASLMVEDHGREIFDYRWKGENTTRPTTVGNQVYLHATAGGKAVMAELPEKIRR